jgi:peptidoglycan/xylan/chitin deacetylase (PgdA/CDA1 family)
LLLVVIVVAVANSSKETGPRARPSPASGRHRVSGPVDDRPATPAELAAVRRLAAFGYPLLCGGGNRRIVALTFDDGPGPLTIRAMHLLHRGGAGATFFLVGKELEAWPGLEGVPRRERALGAVGDHTWNHVSLVGASADTLASEVDRTQRAVADAAGGPVTMFRPPFGAHDAALDGHLRSTGMLEVLWSVDSGDSQGATADQIVAAVKAGLRPGAIVLLHENRGTTLHALPRILRALEGRGLRAVSVPRLVAEDPPTERQLRSGSCA